MDAANQKHTHCTELERLSLELAGRLLELYLPALETSLLEMADTERGEKQLLLLGLVRELKARRVDVTATFKQYLSDGFALFERNEFGGEVEAEEDLSTDLSLIANDELEQELAAKSIARRAAARCPELLQALDQRMAVVNGGQRLPEDSNPLGPHQFANALRNALRVIHFDGPMPLQVYRLFEKRLTGQLEPFYKAANQYLIDHDVLPNLRARPGATKKTPESIDAKAGSSPAEEASTFPATEKPASPPAVNSAAENELYQAIRQIQQGSGPAASSSPQPQSGGVVSGPANTVPASGGAGVTGGAPTSMEVPAYSPGYFSSPAFSAPVSGASSRGVSGGEGQAIVCAPGEVGAALQSVSTVAHAEAIEQADVPEAMTVAQYQAVTTQLKQHLGDDKRLSADEGRVIDLVGMIFEYMLGDQDLPDAVKAVLSYLHTPYLKVAFLDGHLFESPEHSSRLLLNSLAEAGSRWVNAKGESQFRVFSKIKDVVRRILKEFSSDLTLFDDLLLEMQEFNRSVERSVGLMERRARQKAEGEERLREGKRTALRELKQRMQGYELPSYCIVLLLHPWLDYLTFNLLRHGENSTQWKAALQMVEDIIWSVQPQTDPAQLDSLRQITHGMQESIQEGLETVGYDPVRSRNLLKHLQDAHELMLESKVIEVAQPEERARIEEEVVDQLGGAEPDPAAWSAAERDLVEKLRLMEYGTWLEFDELDEKKGLRAKVAWFNPATSRYMLVDLGGKQIAMKRGLDIARLMLVGKARMISGSAKPFFERALEHILARLKASVQPAG